MPRPGRIVIEVDFTDPEYRENPFPTLAWLREHDPVHLSPNRTWIVTRYDDVDALNHDRRLGRDLRAWAPYRTFRPYLADSALEHSVERWILNLDPPDHTRLRRSSARFFTPAAMAEFAATIQSITDGLLAELNGVAEFDFIESFAHPQAARVIQTLLSIPPADLERVEAWGRTIAVVLEPAFGRQDKLAADASAGAATEYLQGLVRSGHLESSGELARRLAAIHADGGMTEDELIALYVSLVVTAVGANIVGNGMFHLLCHPGHLEWLRRPGDQRPGGPRGHRGPGHGHPTGPADLLHAGGGQPRPRGVPGPRPVGPGPRTQPPRHLRRGHPPLPWSGADQGPGAGGL